MNVRRFLAFVAVEEKTIRSDSQHCSHRGAAPGTRAAPAAGGTARYDTASTLARWLGTHAAKYGNPETLFDAKTQKKGVGYSDKVAERASKASDFLEKRESGSEVINGVIFHTRHGVFFQHGIDH